MVGKPLAASEHDSDKCVIMNYSNRFSLLERLLTNPWQLNSLSGCVEFQSVKKNKNLLDQMPNCWTLLEKMKKSVVFFLTFPIIKLHFLGGYTNKTLLVWQVFFIIILVSFFTLLVIGYKLLQVFYVFLPVVLNVILLLTVLSINLFFSPSPLHDMLVSSPPVLNIPPL